MDILNWLKALYLTNQMLFNIIIVFTLIAVVYKLWFAEKYKLNLIIKLLIFGVFLIIIGYAKVISNDFFNNVIIKFGDIFAISGVIGYVSSVDDILRPYRNELMNILYYDKAFMEKLKPNEIKDIWLNSSSLYFNNRFKNINEELLSILNDEYFSSKRKMYYENMEFIYVIKWIDRDLKIVSVEETTTVKIHTEDKSIQHFVLDSSIDIHESIKDKCGASLNMLKINGKDVTNVPKITTFAHDIVGNKLTFTAACCLEDSETYHIKRKITKSYSLLYDNSICFKSRNITKGLSVIFHLPEDINLCVMERGLINNFEIDNKITMPNICKVSYSNLILPKQGFSAIILIN